MLFEEYFITSEFNNWKVESDIDWSALERDVVAEDESLLQKIKASCLIESHHPIGTGSLIPLLAEDVNATAIISIELYEGFKHFYVLKKYLDSVASEKVRISVEEIEAARKRAIAHQTTEFLEKELVTFMVSEHFAAYFFLRISQHTKEPVLRKIAAYIAQDEFRHAQAAYAILESCLKDGRVTTDQVLEEAYQFQHYGYKMVDEVPVFQQNDVIAIHSFIKKIQMLTGERMVDYVKRRKNK